MKLDILAFGAHADDVEIGMAATIIKYAKQGLRIGICDLTEAELSSNGNVVLRKEEAAAASEVLHLATRINLGFPDRGLQKNAVQLAKLVEVIRTYKPTVVFAPYHEDRHPDHAACAALVEEAVFSAGIRKYLPAFAPYRPQSLHFYMINGFHKPSFCIDVSQEMEQKIEALRCYRSQFADGEVATPLTDGYVEAVLARDTLFGKEVGVAYAEGFMTKKPLLVQHDLVGRKV